MNEQEIWKVVPTHPQYEVSNMGRVKRKGRIRANVVNKKGYQAVILQTKKEQKRFYVHRLVALLHLPTPCPSKDQVNHIDCNKSNNSATNLEWCTRRENMDHAIKNGKMRMKKNHNSGFLHHRGRMVLCESTGIFYGSIREAALSNGLTPSSVLYGINTHGRFKTIVLV